MKQWGRARATDVPYYKSIHILQEKEQEQEQPTDNNYNNNINPFLYEHYSYQMMKCSYPNERNL